MFVLNRQNSVASQFLAELRDVTIQNDRLRFRRNLERLGEIMAYEISKEMDFRPLALQTPLESTEENALVQQPVVISIMRAAMPLFQGVINYFDQADCGFVGAFRREVADGIPAVEIDFSYMATPDIDGKEVILVDPMLATGKSIVASLNHLFENGKPSRIHIVSVIAAPEGINHIKEKLSVGHKFWVGALDEKLNDEFFIVPGLGDAGDLAYGPKL